MFNSHGTNARSYHYTLPLPRSAVPFESLWDCRTNINIFQSTLPPCDKDCVLPVLCPVLRLLGGHLLSNPSPRRELVNPEEEQHIFGEWWKRWWSWMKPANVPRTFNAKVQARAYMQDHILWTDRILPALWKALLAFPFAQDPTLRFPQEKCGREKIPPQYRHLKEFSCKREMLISRDT